MMSSIHTHVHITNQITRNLRMNAPNMACFVSMFGIEGENILISKMVKGWYLP